MNRRFILVSLLLLSVLCFSQQNSGFRIVGGIPIPEGDELFKIQVGAYKVIRNADRAFERLVNASLSPVYEDYMDFTRVVIKGISARDIPIYLDKIEKSGFREVMIKVDTSSYSLNMRPLGAESLPTSDAVLPSASLTEVAYRSVRVGETKSLADIWESRNVTAWENSTPSTVAVDAYGNITGLNIGNALIGINQSEYVSVVVVPQEEFYVVPDSFEALLPPESKMGDTSSEDITEYRTEPTFRLAYRFNNRDEYKGASGRNGGIDILGRGADYRWLWTTFMQGGWFYDLNGEKREMVNGYQKSSNGVTLTVKPEFVYYNGVPYLQLRHLLYNPNNFSVSDQKFGASADVMIHQNDYAALVHTPYGAYMTDSASNPSLELMFVGEAGDGITPVETLWLGTWDNGAHINHIYDDSRFDISGEDSAIGFSYQSIDLLPGETKEFIVRFTLARNEK